MKRQRALFKFVFLRIRITRKNVTTPYGSCTCVARVCMRMERSRLLVRCHMSSSVGSKTIQGIHDILCSCAMVSPLYHIHDHPAASFYVLLSPDTGKSILSSCMHFVCRALRQVVRSPNIRRSLSCVKARVAQSQCVESLCQDQTSPIASG